MNAGIILGLSFGGIVAADCIGKRMYQDKKSLQLSTVQPVPVEIAKKIVKHAQYIDVPLVEAVALIRTESNYIPTAYNANDPGGAYGLGQLTMNTAYYMTQECQRKGLLMSSIQVPFPSDDPATRQKYKEIFFDVDVNLIVSFYYWKKYRVNGDPRLSYLRYNAGPARGWDWYSRLTSNADAVINNERFARNFEEIKTVLT